MANKVLLKKSSVAAKVPLVTDLDYGELALNYSDGKLYYKNAANAVTPLSDASKLALAGGVMTGSTTIGTGNYIRFGPNPTWASTLQVGGDGVSAITRTATIASVVTTNGNLHLDSGSDKAAYLNFYSGTGGVIFGNGASATTATVSAAGVFNGTNITVNGNQTLHAGNYTSYSPTLTGGSASGTWGISVSGNAATTSQTAFSDLSITGAANKYLYINPGNGYEAMVRYNGGSGSGWYVGKRIASQTVGTEAFHFYSEAVGKTVAGIDTAGNIIATGTVSGSNLSGTNTGDQTNISGSSGNSNALNSTGYGNGNFTWRQDSGTFAGQTGWASYLISNHGDGSNYFNQTLIMPFYSAPQYSRRVNNVLNGPFTLLSTENYNSYSPTLTGGSASGTWGISVTGTSGSISGYNNPTTAVTANTIAYRDSAGDIAAREFVMSSAVHDDAIPSSIVGVFPTTNQLVKFSAAKTAAFLSGQAMNISGSSDNSNALNSTGYGNGNFTWRQDSGTFAGQTGWASYLISNHGDGSSYYNQTLIMPFYSAPQYSRRANNVLSGPFTLLSTENYNSYSPTLTGGSASGTWSISVTGSATSVTGGLKTINGSSIIGSGDVVVSATVANFTATISANPSNVDSPVTLDVIGYCSQAGLPFSQTDGGLYSTGYSTAWYHQIYGDFRSGQIAVRGKNSGTWQAWRIVLDSSNYSGYALPISGGTLTGRLISRQAGVALGIGNSSQLEINNAGSGACNISFHREGVYGAHFGLDTDNWFSTYGWSAGGGYTSMRVGALVASGNVTAYSDERLKKDWEALPINFVQNLALVKVGTFTRIDSEERQVGVSAQSLKNLMPEAVIDGEYLSVAYGNAALASAVELAKEVMSLNARIARLEALVSKLIEG